MISYRPDGRLGTLQLADVYGSKFGPTTEQIGARVAAGQAPAPTSSVVVNSHEAIAAFFLQTAAGVALLAGAALIVLSLSD